MPKIIKVRCNGPAKHINEVDLDKALETSFVLRGGPVQSQQPIESQQATPERIVLRCRECNEGKVIITRQMLQENL